MKKIKNLLAVTAVFLSTVVMAQIKVSNNFSNPDPHASAMFEIESVTKGFLAPRITTIQRNAIASPA